MWIEKSLSSSSRLLSYVVLDAKTHIFLDDELHAHAPIFLVAGEYSFIWHMPKMLHFHHPSLMRCCCYV